MGIKTSTQESPNHTIISSFKASKIIQANLRRCLCCSPSKLKPTFTSGRRWQKIGRNEQKRGRGNPSISRMDVDLIFKDITQLCCIYELWPAETLGSQWQNSHHHVFLRDLRNNLHGIARAFGQDPIYTSFHQRYVWNCRKKHGERHGGMTHRKHRVTTSSRRGQLHQNLNQLLTVGWFPYLLHQLILSYHIIHVTCILSYTIYALLLYIAQDCTTINYYI